MREAHNSKLKIQNSKFQLAHISLAKKTIKEKFLGKKTTSFNFYS